MKRRHTRRHAVTQNICCTPARTATSRAVKVLRSQRASRLRPLSVVVGCCESRRARLKRELAAMRKEKEHWESEWREVQDRRYDEGFYPGSGKINPFFRRLGAPNRRFGIQLLVLSVVLLALPVISVRARQYAAPLVVMAVVFGIGGVSHVRAGGGSQRG